MKVKIIKENKERPFSWYNEVKPSKGNISGTPSKVGQIFEVDDANEKEYITKEAVFGAIQGFINKLDCIVINKS